MAATGICRNSVDTAGGALISSQSSVKANGENVIVNGNSVTPHGDSPHTTSRLVSGSGSVYFQGKSVARSGDVASCGHSISSSSTNVNAN